MTYKNINWHFNQDFTFWREVRIEMPGGVVYLLCHKGKVEEEVIAYIEANI